MRINMKSDYYHLQQPSSRMRRDGKGRFCSKFYKNRILLGVAAVLVFGVALVIVNIYQLQLMRNDHQLYHTSVAEGSSDMGEFERKPVLWVVANRADSGYLQHVYNVFSRAGYQRSYSAGYDHSQWDVLWAHDYPFVKLKEHLLDLKPHQRVNHYPGSGYITNKAFLVTSKLQYTPKAFRIPTEKDALLDYAAKHPEIMWVQKSGNHRGIQIKPVHALDLKTEGTFVQQYIHDPYLIDGYRFDIGVYVVLTSIDPLRIYLYDEDWLIRFCAEPYNPFNKNNIRKYVVTDDYKPIWKIRSLDRLYNMLDYSMKETILANLRQEGRNADKLTADLRQAIVDVYLSKESQLIESTSKYKSKSNYFEMVRFDFVLDNDLNVYLMEVNMSPNLSSAHFHANRLLYEHVMYGVLSVVGVIRHTENMPETSDSDDEKNMLSSSKDIRVYSDMCVSEVCLENCGKPICKLCGDCTKSNQIESFKKAYIEHNNRITFRRVFPLPFQSKEDALSWKFEQDSAFNNLTASNQWMTLWFHGKCIKDTTWCS